MTELERLRKSFNRLAEKHMETEAQLTAAEAERDEARKEAKSLAQMHADDYDKRLAAEARAFAAARARDEAQQEAARLREADRWIPVTERLPEQSGTYLVYSPDVPEGCGGNVWQVAFFDYKMRGVNEWATSYPVTHWQPLPEPPALTPALEVEGE